MIKSFCLLLLMFIGLFLLAQNKAIKKGTNPDSSATLSITENKYGIVLHAPHLDSLIIKIRKAELDSLKAVSKDNNKFVFSMPIKLSQPLFDNLTAEEKFVYALKYPERYTQVCSMPSFDNPNLPFLHAALPFKIQGEITSKRQYDGLEISYLISVSYLNQIIKLSYPISNEYKQAIVQLHAFECIPALMFKYDTSKIKDNYILTTGVLLMKNDSFPAFINTDIYTQLYKGKVGWREKIDLTETIKGTIIDLINKYYLWKQGK